MIKTTNRIRQALDPNSTLPPVTLEDASGTQFFGSHKVQIDGETIGRVFLEEGTKHPDEDYLSWIKIDEPGGGRGIATYLWAIERAHESGHTFRTHDKVQTADAARMWQRFIDAGIAEVVEPLAPSSFDEQGNATHFKGHVRIPPQA